MANTFITKIQVNESRNIKDLTIPLSENKCRHLVITGKNGSGKTSLLNDLFKFLQQVDSGKYPQYSSQHRNLISLQNQLSEQATQLMTEQLKAQKKQLETAFDKAKSKFNRFGGVEISFNNTDTISTDVMEGDYLVALFDAKRYENLKEPAGINKITLKKNTILENRQIKNLFNTLLT